MMGGKSMFFQIVLGALTLLSGGILVAMGTDFGNNLNLSMGVIIGSVMTVLGMVRLKNALNQRK